MSVETWILGIVLVVVELAITTVVGLVITKWWNKKEKDKEELETLRENARAEQENARCKAVKDSIHEELTPIREDLDLMKKGMQKDLRRSLRQDGEKYLKRGWASHQEKTEFDELYWSYHNLGRNGVVDNLHERIMQLPDIDPNENSNN